MINVRRSLTALLVLAFPATAGAAPFGELPSQRVAGGSACLAPTGAPGELSRWARGGGEVLAATPDGLGAPARIRFGELPGCPRVVSDCMRRRPRSHRPPHPSKSLRRSSPTIDADTCVR